MALKLYVAMYCLDTFIRYPLANVHRFVLDLSNV
jgi:hypothetical protein